MKLAGFLLLLAGLVLTLLLRFSNAMAHRSDVQTVTERENVTPVQWAPAIGSVLIVAGVAIVIIGRKGEGGRKSNINQNKEMNYVAKNGLH